MLIRPSALGDVCRTVPVLASLRAAFPDAVIHWLVQDSFAQAIEAHPALSGVVPFPRRELALPRLWRPSASRRLWTFLGELRAGAYDLVLDLQGLGRSGFFAWATGAPERIGYARAAELGWLGLTTRVDVARQRHTVDRMLDLAEAAGARRVLDLRLYTTPTARDRARQIAGDGAYIVVAPTSRWLGKRWPAERFAAVIGRLLDGGFAERVVVVGGGSERGQCVPILELAAREPRVVDAIGATDIASLMALIERARLVLANDSAALHMGVGFGRPILGLFGPTRIDLVGPYGRHGDVLQACAPGPRNRHKDAIEGARAMDAITTHDVFEAVAARLVQGDQPVKA